MKGSQSEPLNTLKGFIVSFKYPNKVLVGNAECFVAVRTTVRLILSVLPCLFQCNPASWADTEL